jgi:transcriptional regulator with XRE-family HTH domain
MKRPELKIVSSIKEPTPQRPREFEFCQADLAHRLRAVRIALGITESAAAAACKASLRAYRRWEAGGPQRNCLALSGFEETFGVSVAWISFGSGGDPPSNPIDGKIAFMSAPRRTRPLWAGPCRILSTQELGEKYEALTVEQKAYVSGFIAGIESLRGKPPPAT